MAHPDAQRNGEAVLPFEILFKELPIDTRELDLILSSLPEDKRHNYEFALRKYHKRNVLQPLVSMYRDLRAAKDNSAVLTLNSSETRLAGNDLVPEEYRRKYHPSRRPLYPVLELAGDARPFGENVHVKSPAVSVLDFRPYARQPYVENSHVWGSRRVRVDINGSIIFIPLSPEAQKREDDDQLTTDRGALRLHLQRQYRPAGWQVYNVDDQMLSEALRRAFSQSIYYFDERIGMDRSDLWGFPSGKYVTSIKIPIVS